MFNRPQPNYKRPMTPIAEILQRGWQRSEQMHAEAAYAGYEEPLLNEPSCAKCGDLGVVFIDAPVGHPMFGKAITCPNPDCHVANENRARRLEKLRIGNPVPSHYADLRFDNWRTGWRGGLTQAQQKHKLPAFYAAKAFAENDDHSVDMVEVCKSLKILWEGSESKKNSLVFCGPVGTGKTAITACIVRALIERGIDVAYYRGSELIERIRTTYDKDADLNTSAVMELLKTPSVLVVDELVMTSRSADSIDKMETIIDYRLGEGLPMIATCNGGYDDFETVWGIRSLSRMKAAAHWIYVGGDDLRNEG